MRQIIHIVIMGILFTVLPVFAQDDRVKITWPLPVYVVQGTVDVRGTANADNMQAYYLEVSPFDAAEPAWTPVTLLATALVVDGVLAQWQTTTISDGIYQLRLHVLLSGNQSTYAVVGPIRVANTLQAPQGETVTEPQALVTNTPEMAATPEVAAEPTLVPRPNPVSTLPVPVGGQVTYFKDDTIAKMQGAGMTWVKWQIEYVLSDTNLVNVARDRINWGHAAGFNVLLSITGHVDELTEQGESYYPQYAAYLGQVAALGVDAIEVWNEENIDQEWPAGRISARSYVEMLKQAYAAIKAADPQVMVITGAPAPTGYFGGCSGVGCDDGDYYANLANNGAANYADCIGVHYNEGILAPRQQGGDPRDNYPTRYFPLMLNRAANSFRGSDIPLCFTELGYLTPEGYGPLPPGYEWGSSTSVAEQSEWLRDAIDIASQYQSKRVAMIIVFNIDFDRYDTDPQAGYAIIRADGTCPACDSIASLAGSG